MRPPAHVRDRACVVHTDPPCGKDVRPYASGLRCEPPDTRTHHPLNPKPEEAPR